MNLTWINGKYIESSNASLAIGDLAIQRGYGAFDFLRVKHKRPFLLSHYLDRFYNSASGLNLTVPLGKEDLVKLIYEFIDKNNLDDHGIKMILTGGYASDGYTPMAPNLVINAHKISFPDPQKYKQGFKIMTHEYQRESPEIKSINYMKGIQLVPVLQARGLDDVLYHDAGTITEFPRSNVFMVDQQQHLLTPAHNVLAGITRKTVLHLANDHYITEAKDISLDQLSQATEVFITSTTKGILPVCEIDCHPVAEGVPGPVTKHLADLVNGLPPDFEILSFE